MLWNWFSSNPDKKYTEEDVKELVERIKQFNAGAIDEYLSKHVDTVYREWHAEKE